MKEFKKVDQVFIKSNNTVNKIYNRYLYCLIPFVIFLIIYNLIWGSISVIISFFKFFIVSLIICTIIQYIFNLKNKQKNFSKIFLDDQVLPISIILSLFANSTGILTIIISSIITMIIKNITQNKTLSSVLYGLLFILISKYYYFNIDSPLSNLAKLSYVDTFDKIVTPYGNILDYSFGLNPYYLSPILSVLAFIYLFRKKSIKYNIVLSYLLTIIFPMLILGLFNHMNIWYLIFQLTTGNLLFLSVFILPSYKDSPITFEEQIIYGIVLGLITIILRFIVPELSVVLTLILGVLLINKLITRIGIKLKYNKRYYYTILSISIILVIISTIIINIII